MWALAGQLFFQLPDWCPLSALNGLIRQVQTLQHCDTSERIHKSRRFKKTVAQLYLINQQQRELAIAQAQQIFRALPSGPCVPGWLPGPSLPFTPFSAPGGRITCNAQGTRTLVVDFNGVPEGQRVGKAGQNIMRADPIRNVDIGIIKNTEVAENVRAQLWVDCFNAFNSRNFGIPSGVASSPSFLNQWATDGGNRRVRFGVRLVF